MLEKETNYFNCREYFQYDTLISIDMYVLENGKKNQGEIAARLASAWRQKAAELGSVEQEKTVSQEQDIRKTITASQTTGYVRLGELKRDYFSVIDGKIREEEIQNIFVLDKIPKYPGTEKYDVTFEIVNGFRCVSGKWKTERYDVSYEKDGSVILWTEKSGEGYDLYIAGEGGIKAPQDCSNLFGGYKNVKKILFSPNFRTDNVKNMRGMFWGCRKLEEICVSDFCTYNVRSMSGMFNECNHLRRLNINNFNTSNVTDMSDMFYGCEQLEEIDVHNFETSSVENMSGMFYGCKRLNKMEMLRQCEGWKDLMQAIF